MTLSELNPYLATLHEDIIRDYNRDVNGKFRNCQTLAADIYKQLTLLGQNPSVLWMYADRNGLKPRLLPKLQWWAHVVTCIDDTVFDPLIGRPVKMNEYMNEAFENNPAVKITRIRVA